MATVKLVPRVAAGTNATFRNSENMYTDVSSDTYGTFHSFPSAAGAISLYGFDFSLVPDNVNIISVKYRIKIRTSTPVCSVKLQKRSSSSTDLCDAVTVSDDGAYHIIELTPSDSFDTIKNYSNYGSNHPFAFYISCDANSGDHRIYGAEIAVTYGTGINEIIFGGEPLIDLTSDTVTAADVASGKTFHLASGVQATGTLSANGATVKKVTKELSMNGSSITFTSLSDEPKCFIVRVKNDVSYNSSTSSYKIVYVTYDGTNTTGAYLRGGTSTSTSGVIYNTTKYSFTYSSGSLKVSSSGSSTSAGGGFIIGEWELIYAY